MILRGTQLDELEHNIKKIPHRNGIWGLEAIVMYHVVSPTNLKYQENLTIVP